MEKEKEKEIWKDISGYENVYQISSYGRVKSLARFDLAEHFLKERIMNNKDNKNGYKLIGLCDENKKRHFYQIHRLVGFAFVEGYQEGLIINHKDEIKSNNYFKNLEWCTHKYNANYGNRNKKVSLSLKGKNVGKYIGKNNKLSIRVVCLTTLEYFDCITEATKYFNIKGSRSHISRCCKKSNKRHSAGKHPKTNEKLTWIYFEDYIKKYNKDDLIYVNMDINNLT